MSQASAQAAGIEKHVRFQKGSTVSYDVANGDTVEVEIDGVGILKNFIAAA